MFSKIQNVEEREAQVFKIIKQRDQEIEDRLSQIDDLKKVIEKKDDEISKLNK